MSSMYFVIVTSLETRWSLSQQWAPVGLCLHILLASGAGMVCGLRAKPVLYNDPRQPNAPPSLCHVGLLGTMAQLYLSDLKEKTRRGQLGRALAGKIPGGKAYGYQLVAGERGERRLNDAEAVVVRRIFRGFVARES